MAPEQARGRRGRSARGHLLVRPDSPRHAARPPPRRALDGRRRADGADAAAAGLRSDRSIRRFRLARRAGDQVPAARSVGALSDDQRAARRSSSSPSRRRAPATMPTAPAVSPVAAGRGRCRATVDCRGVSAGCRWLAADGSSAIDSPARRASPPRRRTGDFAGDPAVPQRVRRSRRSTRSDRA